MKYPIFGTEELNTAGINSVILMANKYAPVNANDNFRYSGLLFLKRKNSNPAPVTVKNKSNISPAPMLHGFFCNDNQSGRIFHVKRIQMIVPEQISDGHTKWFQIFFEVR